MKISNLLNKRSYGFSLIELMVVVSIIVILSAIGIVNYNAVAEKGRDSRRKADLEQIRGALELYRVDEGSYPPILYTGSCNSSAITGPTSGLTYMQKVPCDPKENAEYSYLRPNGFSYTLGAVLEIPEEPSCLDANNYCITNP